jgi:4'-phosphopantetheinyl transferase
MRHREHWQGLACGEVHVWYTPTAGLPLSVIAAQQSLLSRDELERCEQFRTETLKRDFAVARALVRAALSLYVDVPPRGWEFGRTELGRPFVATPAGQGLAFSLSHTIGLVACAVAAGRDVGVDAEWLNRPCDLESIVERCFSRAEAADVALQGPSQRRRRVLEFWTLKEAYAKARGLGLALPFDGLAFQLGQAVRASFSPAVKDNADRWCFGRFTVTPEYLVAVAATRHSQPVRFRVQAMLPVHK